jgi:TetR/AcrR family transcriptional repressor of bet genes
MPKLGMEPIRRDALVKATIATVGQAGSLDVTVGQIARAAGMSSALAHHYFGAKEQIFDAAMRHILALYGAEVRAALAEAATPRARVEAVVRASFAPSNFRADAVSAWLTFYVRAQVSDPARRLLTVYQRRLRSNLLAGLRPLVGDRAPMVAETLAALIDGLYIRAALAPGAPDGAASAATVLAVLDRLAGNMA